MKQRDLFLDRIHIDDQYSMQIDPNNYENLVFYENNTVIDEFSLRKRIHTLFKTLQELTDNPHFVLLDQKTKLYGNEININNGIYMKVSNEHSCLTVDFYRKNDDKELELIYLTKMTYMTQKLFNKMLIPDKMMKDETYQDKHTLEFKDMLDILSSQNTLIHT